MYSVTCPPLPNLWNRMCQNAAFERRLRQLTFSFTVNRKLEQRQVIQWPKCGHRLLKVSEYSCKSYAQTEVEECFYILVTVIDCLYKLLLFELQCSLKLFMTVLGQNQPEVKGLVTVYSKCPLISVVLLYRNSAKYIQSVKVQSQAL